jgi:hypothetical protein
MDELIEALTILRKYGNPDYPTICEHDVLMIVGIDPDDVSAEDVAELDRLGFIVDRDDGCYGGGMFISYKYGSA